MTQFFWPNDQSPPFDSATTPTRAPSLLHADAKSPNLRSEKSQSGLLVASCRAHLTKPSVQSTSHAASGQLNVNKRALELCGAAGGRGHRAAGDLQRHFCCRVPLLHPLLQLNPRLCFCLGLNRNLLCCCVQVNSKALCSLFVLDNKPGGRGGGHDTTCVEAGSSSRTSRCEHYTMHEESCSIGPFYPTRPFG